MATRSSVVVSFVLAVLLTCFVLPSGAEDAQTDPEAGDSKPAGHGTPVGALSSDVQDPGNLLPGIRERRVQKDALFSRSPLHGLHEVTGKWKKSLHEAIGLELGLAYTQVFMGLSESLPGTDSWGTNSNVDFLANWEVLHRGKPTQGHLSFHSQGRWDWGTTAPETLAAFRGLAHSVHRRCLSVPLACAGGRLVLARRGVLYIPRLAP